MSEENDSGVDAGSDSNLSVSMSVGSSQDSDDEPIVVGPQQHPQPQPQPPPAHPPPPPAPLPSTRPLLPSCPGEGLDHDGEQINDLNSVEPMTRQSSSNPHGSGEEMLSKSFVRNASLPSTSSGLNIPLSSNPIPFCSSYSLPVDGTDNREHTNKMKPNILGRGKGKRSQSFIGNVLTEKKLRIAANQGELETAERLLAEGTNPQSSDSRGRTALHFAACKGNIQMAALLLSHGANPNQQDMVGNTALHLAACTNHTSMITLLLKYGTDVHTLDRSGRTPIHLAQSKLRILQDTKVATSDELKEEILQVIEMMMEYSRRSGKNEAANLFAIFSSRVHEQNTKGEMNQALEELLSSLSHLSIAQTGSGPTV